MHNCTSRTVQICITMTQAHGYALIFMKRNVEYIMQDRYGDKKISDWIKGITIVKNRLKVYQISKNY